MKQEIWSMVLYLSAEYQPIPSFFFSNFPAARNCRCRETWTHLHIYVLHLPAIVTNVERILCQFFFNNISVMERWRIESGKKTRHRTIGTDQGSFIRHSIAEKVLRDFHIFPPGSWSVCFIRVIHHLKNLVRNSKAAKVSRFYFPFLPSFIYRPRMLWNRNAIKCWRKELEEGDPERGDDVHHWLIDAIIFGIEYINNIADTILLEMKFYKRSNNKPKVSQKSITHRKRWTILTLLMSSCSSIGAANILLSVINYKLNENRAYWTNINE